MRPTGTQLFVAFALLAAPASLGVATVTDAFADEPAPVHADEAMAASAAEEAETVERFEGSVDDGVTAAELDLRIDRGPVQVNAWDKDTYEIEVLASQDADQGQIETEFDETVDDDKLALSLTVDHKPAAGVDVTVDDMQTGDTGQRAIVAHVPAELTYEHVHACEGEDAESPTDGIVADSDEDCVETDQPTVASIHVRGTQGEEDQFDVSWGLHGLTGDTFELRADNGAPTLTELDAAKLAVDTDNGAIEGTQLAIGELNASTDNGAIDLEVDADVAHVETDNGEVQLSGAIDELHADSDNGAIGVASSTLSTGEVTTDNGNIDLQVQPAASGELTLATDNGGIDVQLAHGEDIGYEASAASDNGDVEIALADEEDDDEDADVAEEDDHEHGDEETARTSGYDEMEIQLAIDAESDNGAIEIVEETAETSDEGDAESSSASLATLS